MPPWPQHGPGAFPKQAWLLLTGVLVTPSTSVIYVPVISKSSAEMIALR